MPVYPSKKSSIVSKRKRYQSKVGIALICVFSILLINMIFNIIGFVNSFLYGAFGLSVYPVSLFFIALGIMKIKRVKVKLSGKELIYLILSFVCLLAIVHVLTSSGIINNSYKQYLVDSYTCARGYTAGGIIFSFLCYPIYNITHLAGATTILAILLVLFIALFVDTMYKKKQAQVYVEDASNGYIKKAEDQPNDVTDSQDYVAKTPSETPYDEDVFISDDEPKVEEDETAERSKALKILGLEKEPSMEVDEDDEDLFINDDEVSVKKPQMVVHEEEPIDGTMEEDLAPAMATPTVQSVATSNPVDKEKQEIKMRNKAYLDDIMGRSSATPETKKETIRSQSEVRSSAKEKLFGKPTNNMFDNSRDDRKNNDYSARNQNAYNSNNNITSRGDNSRNNSLFNNDRNNRNNSFNNYNNNKQNNISSSNSDIYDPNLTMKSYEKNKTDYINTLNNFDTDTVKIARANEVYNMQENTQRADAKAYQSNIVNVNEINKIKPPKEKVKRRPYVRPTLDLLQTYDNQNHMSEDVQARAQSLERVLESFHIPAKVCSIAQGPTFTRFELTMPVGISVKKIDSLVPDMQMALACKGSIRTEIPIPGKSAFGVEVPNENKETVGLREVIDSYDFQNSKYTTAYGLGKDISNSAIIGNIEKMPHLLVAGTTGSGKSVCLNSMLISLLYKSSPEDLRLILIDPKRLEFSLYNGLPHLLVPNVITDKDKAMNAFDWLIDEMNRRINYFDSLKAGIRNIDEYNSSQLVKSGEKEKMPKIVVVVDELNELMMQTKKEMESKIVRIAQLSRAVGIHLVLATQRPSTDVITGLVKSNLPSRIAFAVSSFTDSLTILGQGGAETLLGYGDMLYAPVGCNKPHRIQGAFLSNLEVEKVVEFVKANNDCIFDEDLEDQMFNRNVEENMAESSTGEKGKSSDPLMKEAVRCAIKFGNISTTKLQRCLGIGYPRAAKLVDDMEELNYISKKDDKNNRVIFISQQEFEEIYGEDF